ncbi:MAG TPA: zinc-dependent alcohol dehydrogenase family protein [Candidatus Limnocylindrales bacterium]|nr:zinc-dependent alcohol dehydrogenase family protein [Candidatus Limnocylindrales bacterium]
MKAWELNSPSPVETNPLKLREVPTPTPADHEVLVRVTACGICRTDLHVVEGELPPRKMPVIPGHQVVGVVEKLGPGAARYAPGTRVGIPWLYKTDGVCFYCRNGQENLCDSPQFTGYTQDGGFAEYIVAHEDFVYSLPEGFGDLQAAPLLCAGIIGFRCLRVSQIGAGGNLGIYGFGAAGHVCIQVARHWGVKVFICTREEKHRRLALELGAVWAGAASEEPPEKLDASIIFAPAGELVPPALEALRKGGSLVLGGIYMSPIPSLPYSLIYRERSIRNVANNTREDGRDFLKIAAEVPIRTEVQVFPMDQVNQALNALKHDGIRGAAVLQP